MLPKETSSSSSSPSVTECPDGFEEIDEDDIIEVMRKSEKREEVLVALPPDDEESQPRFLPLDVVTPQSNLPQEIENWINSPVKLEQRNNQPTSIDILVEASDLRDYINSKSDKNIYLLEWMKIQNPKNTPIQRASNEEYVTVLICPDNGYQRLLSFKLPKDIECTVDDILMQLRMQIPEEVGSAYLVQNSAFNVRYVVKVYTLLNFNEEKCVYNSLKRNFGSIVDLVDNKSSPVTSFCSSKKLKNEDCELELRDMQCLTSYLRRNTQIILEYPLWPRKEDIIITIEDYKCLNKNQYLNDVIVDFYLRYLTLEKLPPKDQSRTYLFNTYFYTRLSRPVRNSLNHKSLATTRHAEIKRWTKNVNIFKKDFVIIPVHKNAHWFLVVICYPGLIGKNIQKSRTDFPTESHYPCILVFDSMPTLMSIKRSVIVQDLKNYLRCEYAAKIDPCSIFAEEDIVVFYPDVPFQLNSSDCGLYLLQYMENFCKDFIIPDSLRYSICFLSNWFDEHVIIGKREELKQLIIRLAIKSINKKIYR